MGGASAETSLQEASQSLQSTVVMVWANKVKDTENVTRPVIHSFSLSPASFNKSNHFLLPFAIQLLLLCSSNCTDSDAQEDCSGQVRVTP